MWNKRTPKGLINQCMYKYWICLEIFKRKEEENDIRDVWSNTSLVLSEMMLFYFNFKLCIIVQNWRLGVLLPVPITFTLSKQKKIRMHITKTVMKKESKLQMIMNSAYRRPRKNTRKKLKKRHKRNLKKWSKVTTKIWIHLWYSVVRVPHCFTHNIREKLFNHLTAPFFLKKRNAALRVYYIYSRM